MAIDVDFDPFQIFQKHPDPAWIYDLETLRILAVNDAAKGRYGYDDDEFLAMTIADLRTSDEQNRLFSNLKTSTGQGPEQSGPWQHVSKSGEFLYVEIISNSVMFQGRHTRLVIARDASLRVNLEASLFQAQARLRMANWELDLEANEANWSPRLYELLGLDPSTYTNTREEFLALLHPDDRSRYVASQNHAITTRSLFDEEFRIKDPLGRFQNFHEVGEIVARGGKTYFSAVIQDVTNLVTSRAESQRVARQLQNVMEGMTDGFYLLDEHWRVSFINKHGACMLGKNPEDIEGKVIWDLFPDAAGSAFEDLFVKSRKTGQSERLTEYYQPFDRWFEVVAHPGDQSLAVYFRDATEDIKASEYRRLLDTAIQKLDEAVLITQAPELGSLVSPRIIYANEATSHITGYGRTAILGQTLELFFGPATDGPELAKLFAAIRDHHSERVELVSYTRDEEIYWVEINLTAVKDDHDRCTHFIAILSDITARKSAENDLRWAATRDELTGLLNRPMLKGILADHLKDIEKEQATHALFFIDLDDFKNVNDTFGHSLGDMLLVKVANRLKTVVRANDFIGRMSGDEFVVFVPYTSQEDAEIFARQLLDVFFAPFDLTDARIAISASIGLAIAPEDGITTEILIRNADIAMYVSKEDGRNTYTKGLSL